ncbi:MAG: FTR1 family iron permease [Stomatobaculum sp.]
MKGIRKAGRAAAALLLAMVFLMAGSAPACAETKYENWESVAVAMGEVLDTAVELYGAGDEDAGKKATEQVNVAYYKFYEKLGFEKTVMAAISGSRGSEVEHQFYLVKKVIRDKGTQEELKASSDTLKTMLMEDAIVLDGGKRDSTAGAQSGASAGEGAAEGGTAGEGAAADAASGDAGGQGPSDGAAADWKTFVAVLGLTLREGLEAILVIAAIIAYLVKTDNRKYLRSVYAGALLGVLFSAVLALLFNVLAANIGEAESGMGQEIFEGLTMFLAVIVLFYVSNWMLSKSETEVWSKYIRDKVEQSITKGSMYTLSFSAFLAVSREGAELILFFQGMRSNIANNPGMLWGGLVVAALILAVVYVAITRLSIRLPLKPFFTFTSWLMFLLCISFIGKGVYELQEADVIGRTIITAMNGFTMELFGIYDRYETLIPQVILLVITVITYMYQLKNNAKKRAALMKNQPRQNQV